MLDSTRHQCSCRCDCDASSDMAASANW
jgi:hypothetical protein